MQGENLVRELPQQVGIEWLAGWRWLQKYAVTR
jgi:hypothetical protein